MELPFYYSFTEFKKDFNNNFTEWLKHFPNGDIDIFKNEYLNEYHWLYRIQDFTDNIIFEIQGCYHELNGDIYDIHELITILNGHSGYFLDKNLELDDEKNIKIREKRINLIKDLPFNSDLVGGYELQAGMFNKIHPLLIFDCWGYIQVEDIKYKDFQYSVIKIVDFLINGEKQEETENKLNLNNSELVTEPIPTESSILITETNTEDIFKNGGFEIFEKYLSIDTGDNLKKKISFIFQQLKKEDKLRVTNFKILSEWAYNNRFIDKCTYGFLLQDGCFISPSKILTKGRTEKYSLMLNK